MKLGIVGSEGKYWTPEQRTKVVKVIKDIFNSHALCYGDGNAPEYNYDDITLVSGGCGGATSEDDKLKFGGGVDEWSEVIADFLGVFKSIKYPQVNSWKDVPYEEAYDGDSNGLNVVKYHRGKHKGYESRNIEIAEDSTIIYCIDPVGRNWSGGRFTLEKARQLGKEVHFVEIE